MARKLTVKQQIEALKIIVESEKGNDSISRKYVAEKLQGILEGSFIAHPLVEKAVKLKNTLTSSIFGQ